MKPLRKGLARRELAANLASIEVGLKDTITRGEVVTPKLSEAETQAAVLGGALEQTCRDMNIDPALFFRYFNHHTWDLTRTLAASNLLHTLQ